MRMLAVKLDGVGVAGRCPDFGGEGPAAAILTVLGDRGDVEVLPVARTHSWLIVALRTIQKLSASNRPGSR